METMLEIAKTQGISAAIGCFLVWAMNKNYTGVCKRLNKVQDSYVDTLEDKLAVMAEVVERNTEAFTRFTEQTKKCDKEGK